MDLLSSVPVFDPMSGHVAVEGDYDLAAEAAAILTPPPRPNSVQFHPSSPHLKMLIMAQQQQSPRVVLQQHPQWYTLNQS